MKRLDQFFSKKYSFVITIAAISIVAIILRIGSFARSTSDYTIFLKKWCEHFRDNGFKGIVDIKADYNVAYLYFLYLFAKISSNYLYSIKVVSVIFDFICAAGCSLIVRKFYEGSSKKVMGLVTYAVVLFWPTVVLNGSAWGQCDTIYTSFIVFSLYFLMMKKYNLSFMLYGVALAFKLQAIFVLPLYIMIFFRSRNIKFKYFLYIPLVNFIIYIPALIAGRPFNMIWKIYCSQVKHYDLLTLNFPNIYNFMGERSSLIRTGGVCFTIILLAIMLVMIIVRKVEITDTKIIELAVLLIVMETHFLPSMHDRYMFTADVIAVVYFMIKKRHIEVPVIIELMSYNSYMIPFKGKHLIDIHIASVLMFIVIIILCYEFFHYSAKQSNSGQCLAIHF